MKTNLKFIMLFFIGGCISAFAQSQNSEIKHLSEKADLIFTGKVTSQQSEWNKNKTKIYTDVTIAVDEFLKGESSDKSITVTHPGGEIGDVGEWYSHMPKFKNDEEVLLFVKRGVNGNKNIVYEGEQGKMTLSIDKKTGDKYTPQKKKISSIKNEIISYSKAK